MSEECQDQRQQNQNGHNRRLVRLHIVAVRGACAIVEIVDVECELQTGGQTANKPDQQQKPCGLTAIKEGRNVLRCAETQVVLDCRQLWVGFGRFG